MVRSRLPYCLLVWGTTTATNKENLLSMQKKATRAIGYVSRNGHTIAHYMRRGILTLEQLNTLELSKYNF